jgi:pyrroloquinoline quinone (PQQ) biosynthesis protein C
VNRKRDLLELYELFPFHDHPLWRAIRRKELSYQQVIDAEVQHWIRTRAGRRLREEAMHMARKVSPRIFRVLTNIYLEECTHDSSGPSHLDLIERFVVMGGKTKTQISRTQATPGNAAAIALYRSISDRGAGCHLVGAGAVEYYYSRLSPLIFRAYRRQYGMSKRQAETYHIHGPMDQKHAAGAFSVLKEVIELNGWQDVRRSVRDAFVATSLHYDGMLQAATGENTYWNGRKS